MYVLKDPINLLYTCVVIHLSNLQHTSVVIHLSGAVVVVIAW